MTFDLLSVSREFWASAGSPRAELKINWVVAHLCVSGLGGNSTLSRR
jgi:hypothetical protein